MFDVLITFHYVNLVGNQLKVRSIGYCMYTSISFHILPSQTLTSPMSLCLDDLTDASGSDAVLGSELDLVPGSTAQIVQFERAVTGTDKNIFPLLCVVYRVL